MEIESISCHRPVKIMSNKIRLCVHCRQNKTKTKSGWKVYTSYMCDTCHLPLCTSRERDCFNLYHNALLLQSSANKQHMDPNRQDPNYEDPQYQNPNFRAPNYIDQNYQDPGYRDPTYQHPESQDTKYLNY